MKTAGFVNIQQKENYPPEPDVLSLAPKFTISAFLIVGYVAGYVAGYGRAMGGLWAGYVRALCFRACRGVWDAVLPAASPERARSCSAGDKWGAMAAHGQNTAGCWFASRTMGCA